MQIQSKLSAIFTTALITLSACQSSVQTSSGIEYAKDIPRSNSILSKASKVEPLLEFPAKFCMVKMSKGYMTMMEGSEITIWQTIGARHKDWGTLTTINPMIISVVLSEGIGRANREEKASTAHVRLAAARQHCDAILAFENISYNGNHSTSALLYDARNGYSYITASQTGVSARDAFQKLSLEVEQAMGQLAAQLR